MKLTKARYKSSFIFFENPLIFPFKCFYIFLSLNNLLKQFTILQIEKSRGDRGGFKALESMGSGRLESSFSGMSISSKGNGFGNGSGFGSVDTDSVSSKTKGLLHLHSCIKAG